MDKNEPNKDSNEFEGFHQFRTDIGTGYGSFEVFWGINHLIEKDGWYWWSCYKDVIPDSEEMGPFPTSEGAYLDAIGE